MAVLVLDVFDLVGLALAVLAVDDLTLLFDSC